MCCSNCIYPGYPARYPACIMCGARYGQPCTVISGSSEPGDQPGDWRSAPHGPRARPGEAGPAEGFTAVKGEPNHYRGEPHTEQCGPDCQAG